MHHVPGLSPTSQSHSWFAFCLACAVFITLVPTSSATALLTGVGNSANAHGEASFSLALDDSSTETSLLLGGSPLSLFVYWENGWEPDKHGWVTYTFKEPILTGYELLSRDGSDYAELDAINASPGLPSGGSFSIFGDMQLLYGSSYGYLDAFFNFESSVDWQSDGSVVTGTATWSYRTTNENGVPIPDDGPTVVLVCAAMMLLAFFARYWRCVAVDRTEYPVS